MKKITTAILTLALLAGSFSLHAQIFTNYTTASGLPHNNVLCVAEDTLGNLWFGTQDGIAKFDGASTWTIYNTTTNPVIPHNTITAITVDSDNNVWIGTDFGVSMFDGATFTTYTTTNGLGNNRINHIAEAANGDIWFSEFSGATVYNGTTFTAYGTGDGLPFGGVSYIDFDSNDDVYMATPLSGFIHYDGSTFTIYNTTNGLLNNVVNAITIDAADNKWVGTGSGISVFNSNNNAVEAHTILLILPAPDTLNPIEDIKINSLGHVWAGIYVDYLVTEGGVASNYGGSSWTDYDISDGMVGPVIRKMVIDKSDNVWVTTSTGVTKISNATGIGTHPVTATTAFKIYPNPARDQVNITTNNHIQKIQVLDLSGKVVKIINENTKNFSVADLKNGVYFVQVISLENTLTQKLIKQ